VNKATRLFISLLSCLISSSFAKNYVTNFVHKYGRLGHQLTAYIVAKHTARQYNAEYLFNPFPLSNALVLHHQEKHLSRQQQFKKTLLIRSQESLDQALAKSDCDETLFIIRGGFLSGFHRDPSILEPHFRMKLCGLIKPIKPIRPINIPQNATSVAMHVRRGDVVNNSHRLNEKWHYDSYYIAKLRHLLDELPPELSVYIHIFTDDPNPKKIAKKYQQAIEKTVKTTSCKQQITFDSSYLEEDTRRTVNMFNWDNSSQKAENILAAFFNMASFDYLIRPVSSGFSVMAELIGNHKKVLWGLEK